MTVLAALIISVLLYHTEKFLIPRQEETLLNNARNTALYLQQVSPLLSLEQRQSLLEKMVCNHNGIAYLTVINKSGKAINHSEPGRRDMVFNDAGTKYALEKGLPVEQVYERDSDNPESPYHKQKVIDILLPYQDSDGNSLGVINVGLSMEHINEIRQDYYERITITSLIIIILILLLSAVFYRDIILPIRNLLMVFQEMKKGNYNQVCAIERNDELGLLTYEFNNMSTRLTSVLKDLEIRETELELNQEELEHRVKIRTKELEDNLRLLKSTELALRESEKALRVSEEKFSAAFRLSPQAITLMHFETGRYVEVNDAWLRFIKLKREDVIGKNFLKLNIWCHKQDSIRMLRILRKEGTGNNIEIYFRNSQGDIRPFLCSYTNVMIGDEKYVLFVANDISEQKAMEQDLEIHQEKLTAERIKACKLESLGVLAGGLAHDFNNMLTVITGNLSLAKMHNPSDGIKIFLTEIETAALQAQDLTRQLLTFSKPDAPAKQTISISELLRKTVNFALSGSNIICKFSISPYIHNIEADEGQIRQVINNLIINAIQAMPNGGAVSVEARNYTVSNADFLPIPNGDYVVIIIADQGYGIPEDSRNKIFDPYYTTKESGSGLGLATSYSIVNQHEGYITFESEIGQGTTFYVYLPALSGVEAIPCPEEEDLAFGSGRILIMEDTEIIRKMLGNMLTSLGYQAELVSNRQEGVAMYAKALQDNKFDAVIMDLTVPGDGAATETIEELLELDPAAKVILTSGYTNNPIIKSYNEWGFSAVLTKPFSLSELSQALK